MRPLIIALALLAVGCTETRVIGVVSDAAGSSVNGPYLDQLTSTAWKVLVEGAVTHGIAVDPAGNSCVSGRVDGPTQFGGTAQFGATTLATGSFVAKLDSGGEWQWAVSIRDEVPFGTLDHKLLTTSDSAGSCYVAGYFNGVARFGPFVRSSYGFTMFVAKVDSSGKWQWAIVADDIKAAQGDSLGGIAVDTAGNCYVAGSFTGNARFGATTLTSTPSTDDDSEDVFVAKLDSAGSWLWAVRAGGAHRDAGNGISVDSAGNSTITGEIKGAASFGEHITVDASLGVFVDYRDVFVARLDTSGKWRWAEHVGGMSHVASGEHIALDAAGNSTIAGTFEGTVTIGGSTQTSGDKHQWSHFVGRLDSSRTWRWASVNDRCLQVRAMTSDDAGNSLVTGDYCIGGGFSAELDSAGKWVWTSSAANGGTGIAVDKAGHLYVTGSTNSGAFVWKVSKEDR